MASGRRVNTILAADIGSVNTRALLFARVDGEYRLVARGMGASALEPPGDAHRGLAKILSELGDATDRQFLDERGRLIKPEQDDRAGVDCFVLTESAGPPIRALVVGLYPHLSVAAVKRAVASCYIDVTSEAHLEDGLTARGRLNRIVHSRPELIIVTGGADDGARKALLEMLALVREATSLMPPDERPSVIFCGNQSVAAAAREMLSQQLDLRFAANVRPGKGESPQSLQAALGEFYADARRSNASFRRGASMSDGGIQPTARGVETMTAYFARKIGRDVLSVDIGGGRSALSFARAGGVETVVRTDIGLGQSAGPALEVFGEDALAHWLPFHPRPGELSQYAREKISQPAREPRDMRERFIEYALLRMSLRALLVGLQDGGRAAARAGLALLRGAAFTGSGRGALDMLLLADALESEGALEVMADPYGALAALGALAAVEPLASVQLAEGKALSPVGALIRVSGAATPGEKALTLQARRATGENVTREIKAGDVWHLPVPADETVELRLTARRGLSIGGSRRARLRLRGGRGGILFDARLGAMSAEATVSERAVKLLRWYAAVTGEAGRVAIPESWLAGPGS